MTSKAYNKQVGGDHYKNMKANIESVKRRDVQRLAIDLLKSSQTVVFSNNK